MKKALLNLLILACMLVSLSGCQYDFPENSKKTSHTYDEVLDYIKVYLNRDDVDVDLETTSGENENGDHFVNYYGHIDDVDFIISSQQRCHYDSLGEFCKTRYNLYNNYNYNKIKKLLINNNNYPNLAQREETNPYLHIYNITYFDYALLITNENDLLEAFDESKTLYEFITESYANPRFCVIMTVKNSTRKLYICAHQDDPNKPDFGFNEAALAELIDEYYRFYT